MSSKLEDVLDDFEMLIVSRTNVAIVIIRRLMCMEDESLGLVRILFSRVVRGKVWI